MPSPKNENRPEQEKQSPADERPFSRKEKFGYGLLSILMIIGGLNLATSGIIESVKTTSYYDYGWPGRILGIIIAILGLLVFRKTFAKKNL